MENLFANLFRWAHRQDENFVTEAFAFVVNYLLDHEPSTGIALLQWLCFGEDAADMFQSGRPQVVLQFPTEEGVPDIKIIADDLMALVEVKKGSGLGKRQLERYRAILNGQQAETKRLILLTHFPVEFGRGGERPDRHVTWHQVARWLQDHSKVPDSVSSFLISQFTGFLERQRMAIQHVGKEYVSGMEAYVRLVTMIERALDVAGISIYKRPRAGKGFWVCYVGSKTSRPFCVRIRYKKPTQVCFEFVKMKPDPAKEKSDDWQLVNRKLCRTFEMDEGFFEAEAQEQMMRLRTFFTESYAAAQQLCPAETT